MSVTVTFAADSPVLHVLGEELRPLTPAGHALSVEVFETSAHVAHVRDEPERYWSAVERVWRDVDDDADAEAESKN